MTKDEALKLALEALEQLQGGCTDHDDGTVEAITVWCPEVIDAIKEALALTSTKCEEQPAQEPVAVVVEDGFSKQVKGIKNWHALPNGTKLYAAPPAAQPAQDKNT
jgi:hypothetical protein